MLKVGQRVSFNPNRDPKVFGGMYSKSTDRVVGTITYVNKEHQWFLVEYNDDPKIKTSFKFDDWGRKVTKAR